MAEITFEHKFEPGDSVCMIEKIEGRETLVCGDCLGKPIIMRDTVRFKCVTCGGTGRSRSGGRELKRWVQTNKPVRILSVRFALTSTGKTVTYNVRVGGVSTGRQVAAPEAILAWHADIKKLLDAKNERLAAKEALLPDTVPA
jgi:hypothetical protein